MIIDRFGLLYASAYPFSRAQVVDDLTITRAPVAASVGGMSGAFDFYGTANYPVQPMTIRKTFDLIPHAPGTINGTGTINTNSLTLVTGTGTYFMSELVEGCTITYIGGAAVVASIADDTHLYTVGNLASNVTPDAFTATFPALAKAGVEPVINALRKATIAQGENKLWSIGRDGIKRFCWAKCTALKTSEKYNDVYAVPVSIEFFARQGLWYSESPITTSITQATSMPILVQATGNYPANIIFRITSSAGALATVTVTNNTNSDTFVYTGAVAQGNQLEVNSSYYTVTNNAVGAYAGLAIGTNQVNWFRLSPGSNSISVTVTGTTSAWAASIIHHDTYI